MLEQSHKTEKRTIINIFLNVFYFHIDAYDGFLVMKIQNTLFEPINLFLIVELNTVMIKRLSFKQSTNLVLVFTSARHCNDTT